MNSQIIAELVKLGASREGAQSYLDFCLSRVSESGEKHHVLMQSTHAQFKNEPRNILVLKSVDHIRAHILLYQVTLNSKALNAVAYMFNLPRRLAKTRALEGMSEEEITTLVNLREAWYASDSARKVSSDGGKIGGKSPVGELSRREHLSNIGRLGSSQDKIKAYHMGLGKNLSLGGKARAAKLVANPEIAAEVYKKISEARMGHEVTEATREKCRKGSTGKKQTQETKDKRTATLKNTYETDPGVRSRVSDGLKAAFANAPEKLLSRANGCHRR